VWHELIVKRCSALIHPNTGDDVRDHTQRATWMGPQIPLQVGALVKAVKQRDGKKVQEQADGV
jgi:aromatic ring-cleaving dioxygenase